MFEYIKKLQYPVKITHPNPRLAQIIITQYGGPDGELGASLRYLSQRYSMPYGEVKGLLTDIGTGVPEMLHRFIAAEDGLDTAKGFDIMSVFRDVFNEFYVADTSRKIKAVFKSKMEKGLRCSGSIPYGYLAGKEDKNKWIIDEEAAAVVRRIYQSVIDGISINEIGRALRAEQIPIPSAHWERIGAPVRAPHGYADPYAWSATTIGGILKRPEYMGRMVLGKTVCENYRTKTHRKTAPEEQYIFDGAIPVIIDEETWNNAQRLRKTVRRAPKREGAPHRLTGLLYCANIT